MATVPRSPACWPFERGQTSRVAAPVGITRAQVLDAAAALLTERGELRAFSLADVAGRLGIRTQSLYAHVDGLAGLHRALALRGLDALADRLTTGAAGKTGGAAIAAIVEAYERFAREQPGLYDASLRPPGDDDEVIAAMVRVTQPLNDVFHEYGLDGDAATHWYRIVFSSIHGFVTLRRDGLLTLPGDPDETLHRMIRAFVDQLEREVTSPGSPDGSGTGGRRHRRG